MLTADAYQPQTWTAVLKPRQMLNDARKMEPKAVQAVVASLAALVIAGGTPGAQVEVDGHVLGDLNANGGAQFADKLAMGSHQVVFRKEGFCDARTDVTAKLPEVRLTEGKLEACGSLTFKSAEQQATAKVRRAGDADAKWIELPAGRRVQLPAGKYEAEANFAGSSPVVLPDLMVAAGGAAEFAPHPVAARSSSHDRCQLQNPGDATAGAEWLKPNSGGMMMLTPGCVNVSLTFTKPKRGLLGSHRKLEWVLYAGGGAGRIEYALDGGKLTRKVVTQGSDHAETKASLNGDADIFRLRIQVEGQRVRILNEAGEAVDDYTATDPALVNLRGGKVGLKTNAEFKIGGDKPDARRSGVDGDSGECADGVAGGAQAGAVSAAV